MQFNNKTYLPFQQKGKVKTKSSFNTKFQIMVFLFNVLHSFRLENFNAFG